MLRTVRGLCVFMIAVVLAAPLLAQQTPGKTGKNLAQRLGYPGDSRLLIIHADDFGMMHSVNTAIEEAFENHWITSASILVPCPWFPEVARWARMHPEADLGIHLALNADWTSYRWSSVAPQSKVASLLDADGYLPLTTEYVAAHAKMPEVEEETHAQVDRAKAAGVHITHVDTHMGTIASTDDLLKVYFSTAQAYKVPALIIRAPSGPALDLSHFHLEPNTIVLDGLLQIMPGVSKSEWLGAYKKMLQPLGPGTYQLIVHLAHNDAEMQGATSDHPDWGSEWRQNDLDLVRSAEFRQFLKEQGFILISWRELLKVQSSQ
jgi:predicted glycoside hydrolase/deacetylase ChbG (UPF0249 family)